MFKYTQIANTYKKLTRMASTLSWEKSWAQQWDKLSFSVLNICVWVQDGNRTRHKSESKGNLETNN